MMLGTPIYMSPEQCRGASEVDHKADVYSLGVMLYQMILGDTTRPLNRDWFHVLGRLHVCPPLIDLVARSIASDKRARFKHAGELGPDKGRQEKPHGHCGMFDPNGKFCYVCDLGLDRVKVYAIGATTVTPSGEIVLPPGSGPRHISVAPKGNLAFVNGELDFTVNVIKLDSAKGTGEVMQSISTLPGGKPVEGNSTAEVLFHPNGKYVYCSNRGHNSIAAFSWDGSKLTPIGHATKGIKVPRNFNIDPTGQWMLVANQDGNDVAVFKIDEKGVPQPTGVSVPVGKPVCVKFVAKE